MKKILIIYSVVATIAAGAAGVTCFKLIDKIETQKFIITNLNEIAEMKQDRLDEYASKQITIDILNKQIKDAQDQLETLKSESDESN